MATPPYFRSNTRSKKIASFTKAIIERRFKHPMDIAVSTKHHLWLDIDAYHSRSVLADLIVYARAVVEEIGGGFKICETPNGYHIFFNARLRRWNDVVRLLRSASVILDKYIDKNWLSAVLRRQYITLRLNCIRWVYTYRW